MPPASARAMILKLGLGVWATPALVKMSARTATPHRQGRKRKPETSVESNISPPFPGYGSSVQMCWAGLGRRSDSCTLYVGAGIFVNGSIYRGSQWTAGEIGYLRVPNISREHPTIHDYGKLEKLLGAPGILKSWQANRRGSRKHPKVSCAADVFDLAAAGNAEAKRLLQQRATLLADIVLDLALILNPSVILLGGEVGNHPRLLQEVDALLKGSEFAIVRVGLGVRGQSGVLWGAIYSSLDAAVLG